MKKFSMLALVACAGAVATVSAQDSVSNSPGLPGDAPDAFTDPQITRYIVDLDIHFSSWGTAFAVGPVLKTDKSASNFFNNFSGASSISQDVLKDVPFASPSYALWNTPGAGVIPERNSPPATFVQPSGLVSQIAVHQNSFAGNTGVPASAFEGLRAAIINFDPAEPRRLYVTNILSAVNQPTAGTGVGAAFGIGGIDAEGNAILRADPFISNQSNGVALPDIITNNNYLRIRNQDRNPAVLNDIDNSTPSRGKDATDGLLLGSSTTHSPATIVPASIGGTPNGAVVGSNFASQAVFGASAPLTATTAHLPAGTDDQRGTFGFSPVTIYPNSVGTVAILGQDPNFPEPGNGDPTTKQLVIAGVNSVGQPIASNSFVLPDVVSDPCGNFTADSSGAAGVGGGPADWYFNHYRGNHAFRGASGIAAVGFDPVSGKALVASGISDRGFIVAADNPYTAIAVCRFDPANPGNIAAQEWSIAAWVDFDNFTGKPILDDTGASIGTLIDFDAVTGGAVFGPSISVPSFDSRGNMYFLAGVALNKVDELGNPFVDTDTALIRGVYDSANNCYELELIIEVGNVFQGQNSGLNYRVTFLDLAYGNGVDPASFWANSMNGNALGGVDPLDLDPTAPQAMTGLVLPAQIVYDADQDDDFDSPTGANGDPLSGDQAYNVLLYVTSADPVDTGCGPADTTTTGTSNGVPDGVVDISDYLFYLTLWGAGNLAADVTTTGTSNGIPDGVVDISDFSFYLTLWGAGCP